MSQSVIKKRAAQNEDVHFQTLFDTYNRRYFNGDIPRYQVRIFDALCNDAGVLGMVKPAQRLIYLRTLPDPRDMTSCLLHEMAHAATPGAQHGARWQAEIARLVLIKAPIRKFARVPQALPGTDFCRRLEKPQPERSFQQALAHGVRQLFVWWEDEEKFRKEQEEEWARWREEMQARERERSEAWRTARGKFREAIAANDRAAIDHWNRVAQKEYLKIYPEDEKLFPWLTQ